MADSDISLETIKRSQEMLGKFIKKPPLTEKLLRKPPFKFIHDIIKVVIHDTGFLNGLYSENELNADNIKDRDAKMKFLQKLIDVVKIAAQSNLKVKPSKIVAGLEAEKTNELFQAIAYCLENNLDSKNAVESVKGGTASTQLKPQIAETKEKSSTIRPKAQTPSRDKTPSKLEGKKIISQKSFEKKATVKDKPGKDKERATTKTRTQIEQRDTKTSKKLGKTLSKENDSFGESVEKVNGSVENGSVVEPVALQRQISEEKCEQPQLVNGINHAVADDKFPEENSKINGDINHESQVVKEVDPPLSKTQDELAAIIDEEAEYRRKEKSIKKLSAKHRQKSVEDVSQEKERALEIVQTEPNQNTREQSEKIDRFQSSYKRGSLERPRTTSLRPPSARPVSSRPAAPRRREKNIEIILQPDEAQKLGDINVKMENFSKELEDDGENLVIIQDSSIVNETFMSERLGQNVNAVPSNLGEQGHLVQQILETEKNFQGILGMGVESNKSDNEFDESKIQTNIKQIETVKELLQKLVRSVNPLGKLMDFVLEDVDSMQREYTKWNEVYKQSVIDLKREQTDTANAIEPLKYQLSQLDKLIDEHRLTIDQLRGDLVLKEQKLTKLFIDV